MTGRDLQNLSEMQNAFEHLSEDSLAVQEGNLFLLPNNKAWRFSSVEVIDRYGDTYTQVIAADITELYQSQQVLKESNRKLDEHGKRLRELSANINAVTREEEILNMKMRVHDDIGRSVIAARQFLQQHRSTKEFDMTTWKNALRLLKRDSEAAQDKNALEQLMEAAQGIGITIKMDGTLPSHAASAYLLVTAMRECATNAVRHAGATALCAKVDCAEGTARIRITNNGTVPKMEIVEGGGLTSLRMRVERAGGTMIIKSSPVFELILSVPVAKEEVI